MEKKIMFEKVKATIKVDFHTWCALKNCCALNRRTISKVIEELIVEFLSKEGAKNDK